MTWTKTIERDRRGRPVNVYTDEDGWRVVQVKRHRGPGGDPRFFYGDEPRVSYHIIDGEGRERADQATTVAGAKRAVAVRKAIDAGHRDAAAGLPPSWSAHWDEELVSKYAYAWSAAMQEKSV